MAGKKCHDVKMNFRTQKVDIKLFLLSAADFGGYHLTFSRDYFIHSFQLFPAKCGSVKREVNDDNLGHFGVSESHNNFN